MKEEDRIIPLVFIGKQGKQVKVAVDLDADVRLEDGSSLLVKVIADLMWKDRNFAALMGDALARYYSEHPVAQYTELFSLVDFKKPRS